MFSKIEACDFVFQRQLSDEVKNLIKGIIQSNINERLTIEQIRHHAWMQKHKQKEPSVGIMIGYNKIPIDTSVLELLKDMSFDPE